MFLNTKQNGYITLISVIVVGAVGTAIAISLILLGINASRTSFVMEQSNQAKSLANTCAEIALQKIRDSDVFEGSGQLALGQGSCSFSVTNLTGENRTIESMGTVDTIVTKVKVHLDTIYPTINITVWQEVENF